MILPQGRGKRCDDYSVFQYQLYNDTWFSLCCSLFTFLKSKGCDAPRWVSTMMSGKYTSGLAQQITGCLLTRSLSVRMLIHSFARTGMYRLADDHRRWLRYRSQPNDSIGIAREWTPATKEHLHFSVSSRNRLLFLDQAYLCLRSPV
jgi:hypothetical protein